MSSTTEQRRIVIAADLIKDVRIGAVAEMHHAAGRLDVNADTYLSSEGGDPHGVPYRDYLDAFDDLRAWLELLDDLGDDFTVEETVGRIKPTYAARLNKAADYRGERLRARLDEAANGGINGIELVRLAERIAALEDFGAYVHDVEKLYNAECGDEEA